MNELVWTAMIDARDMLVIHFSQWICSATGEGGVLTGLKHCPAMAFSVRRKPSEVPDPSGIIGPRLTDEQRASAGAGPDVVRLSVGIEDIEDIIADLDRALSGLPS